ncbi:AAA family ATPase [Halorientalis sp.]|jgi:MoxR-like ATPase|uniref:AAA family ATPase n=1 Tax=Halorientalis sp. TaxID=1931229 RepID=UPI00261DC90E|nr:AAA family ATPase [Halorientalis sp.]
MTDADTSTIEQESDDAVEAAGALARRVAENVGEVIVGHQAEIEHILTAVLGRGHVLLEDVPGVGKTMLARSIAASFDGSFNRVQFTPDLLPSDITGVNVYNQKTSEFDFRPGPVFANVVLGDEINRAPPKTQSALLEAMEEQQVTVDGDTYEMPDPFTVIATQNTVERDRTYELPMAELDRFMKKLHLGYPDSGDEAELLGRVVGNHPIEQLSPVATLEDLRAARTAVGEITVEEPIRAYVTRLSEYTREQAQLGVSPRGSIALLRAAQARAALAGRDYVVPDDVQAEVSAIMPHRIRTTTADRTGEEIVTEARRTVTVE